MIEFLSGVLAQRHPGHAVIQTGGIGWHLPLTLTAADRLPAEGQSVTVPTYLAVKEDSLSLYGFADEEERDLFCKLIQVNGIGAKLAMTVLSGMSMPELTRALASGDANQLNRIPGIGKKMAERMVVELKDKVQDPGGPSHPGTPQPEEKHLRDAVLALVALGYRQQEARRLLDSLPADEQRDLPVEELVRKALAAP